MHCTSTLYRITIVARNRQLFIQFVFNTLKLVKNPISIFYTKPTHEHVQGKVKTVLNFVFEIDDKLEGVCACSYTSCCLMLYCDHNFSSFLCV